MTSIMISLLNNTSREGMTTEIPANLGTVTRFPQSKTIKSFFTHDFRDYDYNQNVFFDRTISADELIHYINQSPPIDNIDVKFTQFIDKSTLDFKVRGGYWNNDFSMYDNMVNILAKDNALVVNTGGYILRRPGDYVSISIDRNTNQLTSEKRAEL